MAKLGNVPEINEVKDLFYNLVSKGMVLQWELPYENILTTRSAEVFFFTPVKDENLSDIHNELKQFDISKCERNLEKSLSSLEYRVEFKDPDFT